jgi:hypothetical protein
MRLHQQAPDWGGLPIRNCPMCAQTCQCYHHPFTPAEDLQLVQAIGIYGPKRWSLIALTLPNRTPKQCRERWHYHLNPSLNKGPWTAEEDRILFEKHEELGNRWTEIAKFLPGRTDSLVKSRWNSALRSQQRESCAMADRKLELQPIWALDFNVIAPLVLRERQAGD